MKVVDENGFSSAARALNLSTSYVSRQLSALENRLGVRLLNRSTRRQSLTPVGALFYRNCSNILAQLEEAELAITQLQSVPRGLLRVNAPEAFGSTFVAPIVAAFMAQHDELEVELGLGETAGKNLLSREIAPLRRLLVASPDYIADRGRPTSPDDLSGHALLLNNHDPSGHHWQLHGPGTIESVSVRPTLSSNSDVVLKAACVGAQGIAYLPDYLVGAELADGQLVHVLPDYVEDTVGIHAIYPENKHLSARVRLFIDALVDALGPNPPWAFDEVAV